MPESSDISLIPTYSNRVSFDCKRTEFYCYTYESAEKVFLNITFEIRGLYKIVSAFVSLWLDFFYQQNLHFYLVLDNFAVCIIYVFPTGKKLRRLSVLMFLRHPVRNNLRYTENKIRPWSN